MTHQATHYDATFLQRLLDESLPEALADEVVEHLSDCGACRQQLESLAGDNSFWLRACSDGKAILSDPGSYLSSSADESSVDASSKDASGVGRTGRPSYDEGSRFESSHVEAAHEDEAARFAMDFAVDCLEPSDDSAMLGRLGEYEIIEVIGRGGMGVVLKGFQQELHRYVAVKVLAPHLASSGAARRRFDREAQATAAVVNPHVMAIHSVNANAKLPYLVMPFVECQSLQQRLDQRGPLEVRDVLRIGMQAALGLAAAHAQGLVHRDVKPANILLETNVDRVMLTDFGLARAVDDATLTRTGIIAGTPQYMSPEQANGDAVDHRSDLFSLGSVLYAMCTARPPFRAETTFGVLRRIRETAPRPIREINADIPAWLDGLVMNLLSKDPSSRIASAKEVASLLEQCLAHVQQPTAVGLPKSVVELGRRGVGGLEGTKRTEGTKGFLASWAWLGRLAGSTRFAVPVMVGTVVMIAALAVIFLTPPTSKENGAASPTNNDASLTNNPLLEWNATQTELDQTFSAIEHLEAEAKKDD